MNEFTDGYLDVLQDLEFVIVTTYKQRPEMTDYDVMRIMEALIDGYQAETIGRLPRYSPVTDVEIDLMDILRIMYEWRLGRIQLLKDERMKELEKTDPKTLDEIVACLKEIHNSLDDGDGGGSASYCTTCRGISCTSVRFRTDKVRSSPPSSSSPAPVAPFLQWQDRNNAPSPHGHSRAVPG
jgi:hypothetical protein